jgi:glutaredoxin-like protein
MLDDKIKQEVSKILANMVKPITLKLFTQGMECGYCKETHELLDELVSINNKLKLEVYNLEADAAEVKKYGITEIPAIVIMDEKDYGIRFVGIPAGFEFSSLLNAFLLVSTGKVKLTNETKAFLDGLKKRIHLKVFVTPVCPYCPQSVMLAHALALYSDKVTAEAIELSEFPHLAVKYEVKGVPRTVVNEKWFQEGAGPEVILIDKIKEALTKPAAVKPPKPEAVKQVPKTTAKPKAGKAKKPVKPKAKVIKKKKQNA